MAKATVLVAVACIASMPVAKALPAYPYPLTVKQPDGSTVTVRLLGDENHHVIVNETGDRLMRRDSRGALVTAEAFDRADFSNKLRQSRKPAPTFATLAGQTSFPTHGSRRALAILVEYPETEQTPEGRRFSLSDPKTHFERMLNSEGYSDYGSTGSVHQYFYDASSGVFDLTFDVYGPVTLEHDISYYTEIINGQNLSAWHMTEEACRALDAQIDFSQYDCDEDGVIDNVYIFYAGEGGATSTQPETCVWQHAGDIEQISGMQFRFDGVRLNHYACSNEYRLVADDSGETVMQAEGIGTVCHEFSHVLGLPDFYDTRDYGTSTPGAWAVMDMGCHLNDSRTPPNYSALERMLLGWLDPVKIGSGPETLSLRDISSNKAYMIATADENEYFLLENRQQEGWDAFIPGHGMLVWHIYYEKSFWDHNQVNTTPTRPGVDIVRADGSRYDRSPAGHPFPGASKVTSLTDEGYPNMLSYAGAATGVPITSIMEAGGMISFDVCKSISSLAAVEGLCADDITPGGFTARWSPVDKAEGYVLNVYRADGESREPVGAYRDLRVMTESFPVTGLEPETSYCFTVHAVAGTVTGPESGEFALTTPAMTFAYAVPAGVEISEVRPQSFRASWEPLTGAVDYEVTVNAASAGEPVEQTVDFANGISGLPAGWFTNSTFSLSMKGYYGLAAPALSLSDDYGRLQSPVLSGQLQEFSFWYRERSGAGGAKVQISVLVGSQWVDADCIDLPDKMSEGAAYRLPADKIPAGAVAVRILYRRGSKGSLAIDDVVLVSEGESVRTPLQDWNGRALGSADTNVLVDGLTPATTYYLSVRGIDADNVRSRGCAEVKVVTAESSGVGDIVESGFGVSVSSDGYVMVSGADGPVSICDMNGRIVSEPLPARGVYILRCGSRAVKIMY